MKMPDEYKILEEELYHAIWVTRKVKFCASQRLLKLHKLSNWSVFLLTAYIIITGLLSFLKDNQNLPIFNSEILSITTTSLGILILVFGILEFSNNYSSKANDQLIAARAISNIYAKFKDVKYNNSIQENEKHRKYRVMYDRYNELVGNCFNHSYLDYLKCQAINPMVFEISSIKCWLLNLRIFIQSYLLYYVLISVPPIAIFLIINN